MKKVIYFFGIIAIAALVALSFTACKNNDAGEGSEFTDSHTHAYGGWTTKTAANCTTAEIEKRTCSCGVEETRNSAANPALGHEGSTAAVDATCTTAGSTGSGTCIRCSQTVTSTVIAPLGHEGLAAAFAATCLTAGNSAPSGTCTRSGCGQTITGTVIAALGHLTLKWETYNPSNGHVSCTRSGCSGEFAEIGDTGPAGGIIFYATEFDFYDGDVATTVRRYYLETAPSNMYREWADRYGDLISRLSQNSSDQTDWAIGRGKKNTAIIIAHGSANGYTTSAASVCAALTTGGKNDWFLPSKNELNKLYEAKGRHTDIPTIGFYWSSSQNSSDLSWGQYFDYGHQNGGPKIYTCYIRAIRAF